MSGFLEEVRVPEPGHQSSLPQGCGEGLGPGNDEALLQAELVLILGGKERSQHWLRGSAAVCVGVGGSGGLGMDPSTAVHTAGKRCTWTWAVWGGAGGLCYSLNMQFVLWVIKCAITGFNFHL